LSATFAHHIRSQIRANADPGTSFSALVRSYQGRLLLRSLICLACSTNCCFGMESRLSHAYRKPFGLCVRYRKRSSVTMRLVFVTLRRCRRRNMLLMAMSYIAKGTILAVTEAYRWYAERRHRKWLNNESSRQRSILGSELKTLHFTTYHVANLVRQREKSSSFLHADCGVAQPRIAEEDISYKQCTFASKHDRDRRRGTLLCDRQLLQHIPLIVHLSHSFAPDHCAASFTQM